MVDIGPSCLDGAIHKVQAFPPEPDSLSQSAHRSMDDRLKCGSDGFLTKCVAAPING
jgi:hypothetical protein